MQKEHLLNILSAVASFLSTDALPHASECCRLTSSPAVPSPQPLQPYVWLEAQFEARPGQSFSSRIISHAYRMLADASERSDVI